MGKALKTAKRDQIVICTKAGYRAKSVADFSTAVIRPILEASLRRLQTDYVDILLLHNSDRELWQLYFALAGFVILTGLKNHKSCPTAV